MSIKSEVALAIMDSIEIPADIAEILNQWFTPHKRKSTMNGEYTVYHADYINYYGIEKALKAWLESLPTRLDEIEEIIDCYQLVVYTPENDHEVTYDGYIWFEIELGLKF